MIRLLWINYASEPDGFEQRVAGQGVEIGIYRGPGDAGDMPPAEACRTAQGIIAVSAQHDAGPPERYPNCRIILRMGVGHDNIDGAAWGAAGVPLCNVPDYGTSEVADHAVALMLALVRGTTQYHARLVRDPVSGWNWGGAPLVRRLRGAVFGIVGLGRIGLAAALRARAFGMELAFFDPYAPNGLEIAVGARRVRSLQELMAILSTYQLLEHPKVAGWAEGFAAGWRCAAGRA